MWSLVTSRGQRVALRELPCVLGSDREAADVALPHGSISPRHARVEADGDGLVITALEGALLEVEGATVEQARLAHGENLVLGRVSLRLADDQVRSAAPAAQAPEPEAPDDEGGLVMRGQSATASAPPRSQGKARAKPAAGRKTAAPRERRRTTEPLIYSDQSVKRGLLHADLSQLSGSVKALLVVVLVVVAAGLVWGLSELVAAG
jgi:predicted component of type VI protein secretion system